MTSTPNTPAGRPKRCATTWSATASSPPSRPSSTASSTGYSRATEHHGGGPPVGMSALTPLERALLGLVALLTALAGVANYGSWASVPRFAIATLALAGLAWVVSFATEQLGERFGPGVTGLMQSTLGNLPELFVVIFALQKHELVVAQTAIVGSVFANALLVLGLVIVVGASRSPDGVMRFSNRLPRDTATLLVVTVFIIVVLGLSLGAHDRASHHYRTISAVGAACLLVVYLAWVVPYLRADIAPGQGSGAGGLEGEERAGGSARDRGAAPARVRAPARASALEGEERAEPDAREERAGADGPGRGALGGE